MWLASTGCAAPLSRDAQADTPPGITGTGEGGATVSPIQAARPLGAFDAYPGLDPDRLISTRLWTAAPTDDPGSDRRLTRRSERSTDDAGRPALRITLDDSADTEDSILDLTVSDTGVSLVSMETVDSAMRFTPPLRVWPDAITPGAAVVATAEVNGQRDGKAMSGKVRHTLEDVSSEADLDAGYRRVLSEFVFDLGDARVTRMSIRWFRMGEDPGKTATLVREERSRALKIWILPARTTHSDWSAVTE